MNNIELRDTQETTEALPPFQFWLEMRCGQVQLCGGRKGDSESWCFALIEASGCIRLDTSIDPKDVAPYGIQLDDEGRIKLVE